MRGKKTGNSVPLHLGDATDGIVSCKTLCTLGDGGGSGAAFRQRRCQCYNACSHKDASYQKYCHKLQYILFDHNVLLTLNHP